MKRFKVSLVLLILVLFIGSMALYAQTGTFGSKRSKSQVLVTISCNVKGATVQIDRYRGRSPFRVKLNPGQYSLTVSAPGYTTFRGRVTIKKGRSTQYITISLAPAVVYAIFRTTNVEGATVYVDGKYSGHTPARVRLSPGVHNVKFEAKGFMPLSTRVNVENRNNKTYSFTLTPLRATLTVLVPSSYINNRVKNARRLIQIYVDNRLINKNGEIRNLKIEGGTHLLKIVSGGLVVEGSFNFEPGMVYNVQLYMELTLQQ